MRTHLSKLFLKREEKESICQDGIIILASSSSSLVNQRVSAVCQHLTIQPFVSDGQVAQSILVSRAYKHCCDMI